MSPAGWPESPKPTRAERILSCPLLDIMWGTTKEITPDVARQLLELMPQQRPKRPAHTATIAEDMRRGLFETTHQGIAFDQAGLPLDGQHRLEAIVISGVAVTLMCTFNVPRRAFRKIDRHAKRNASDDFVQLGIVGDSNNGKLLGAAARVVWLYEKTGNPANEAGAVGVESLEEIVDRHPLIVDTCSWVNSRRSGIRMPAGAFGGFLTLFREADDAKAMRFAEEFVTPGNIPRSDAAFALREGQKGENTQQKRGRRAFMFRVVRAWNAFYRGRPVSKLQATPHRLGGFPEIAGYRRP